MHTLTSSSQGGFPCCLHMTKSAQLTQILSFLWWENVIACCYHYSLQGCLFKWSLAQKNSLGQLHLSLSKTDVLGTLFSLSSSFYLKTEKEKKKELGFHLLGLSNLLGQYVLSPSPLNIILPTISC